MYATWPDVVLIFNEGNIKRFYGTRLLIKLNAIKMICSPDVFDFRVHTMGFSFLIAYEQSFLFDNTFMKQLIKCCMRSPYIT